MESSRPKEKRETKEHITPRNGNRHEKDEQELDGIGKGGPGQSGLENAGRRPILRLVIVGFGGLSMLSPWVNDVLGELSQKLGMIADIWNAMGLEGENLRLRIHSLSSHLFLMLDEMYSEEILAKQTIIDSIKELKVHSGFTNSHYIAQRSRSLRLSRLIQEIKSLRDLLQQKTIDDEEIITLITSPNPMENLSLSKNFLDHVTKLRNSLAQEFVKLDDDCQRIIKEIMHIAGRLNIDLDNAVNIQQPVSARFLQHLKEELNRLKKLQLRSLASIISKCQAELVAWWENCLVGRDVRQSYLVSEGQELNESLLISLESESTIAAFSSNSKLTAVQSPLLACSSMVSLHGIGSIDSLSSVHTPITKTKSSVQTPVTSCVSSSSSPQKNIASTISAKRRSARLSGKKVCSTLRVLQMKNVQNNSDNSFRSPLSTAPRSAVKSSRTVNNTPTPSVKNRIQRAPFRT
ncbi:unnamed protein product [Schistosoma margrebowiei]|uniref:Uncharacterized protein n=1 Tax=Schistosoma margrebowiei TaxID=48269 RepID=A0A183LG96_9TREM|nr:unnamed protein product [Schistosoma margrebowiei]